MRVFWFTNTPSLYSEQRKGYGGGGWISSLEEEISKRPGIELAIGFFHSDKIFKIKKRNVWYYPISIHTGILNKIKNNIFLKKRDDTELHYFLKAIEDFQPDLIHIFGSESSFGLIANRVEVPVVIHLQGLLSACRNAYFPPGCNSLDYLKFMNPKEAFKKLVSKRIFNHNAVREERILKDCKFIMGRTDWDKSIAEIYSPGTEYFCCGELLRNIFYESNPWQNHKRPELKIMSTLSKVDYKGFDVILKTARLIKRHLNYSFTWNVFGISEYKFWEKKLNIKSSDVDVNLCGRATPEILISNMLASDVFVHPSYIDNSPNSVCEAQMVGIPVIATNVGGVSSLIEHGINGLFVPANDPYMTASYILRIKNDPKLAIQLASKGREIAFARHNRTKIVEDALKVYQILVRK